MEETAKGGIIRGTIDGKKKYCRIGIRRRRVSTEEAIDYFWDCIMDMDAVLAGKDEECTLTEGSAKEMRYAQWCMVTAIEALKKMKEEGQDGEQRA